MLPLVPPPVALARYIRAQTKPNRARLTYVGGCPGAIDESIDIRMTPEALLSMLAERHISLDDQPRVFESFIPADRRRYRSQPGGLPTVESLWANLGSRNLVEIESDDLAAEVAQHVLAGRNVLIDAATKLRCVCSGAVGDVSSKDARAFLVSLEPPRSSAPVVDEHAAIELDQRVPAVTRTPVDVMAVPSSPAATYSIATRGLEFPTAPSVTPPRGVDTIPETRQTTRVHGPASRSVGGTSPVVRSPDPKEGRTLPRAYVARRRLSPKSTPVVPAEPQPKRESATPEDLATEATVEYRRYSAELVGSMELETTMESVEAKRPATTYEPPEPSDTEVRIEAIKEFDFVEPVEADEADDAVEAADAIDAIHETVATSPVEPDDRMSSIDIDLEAAIPLSDWTGPQTASRAFESSEMVWRATPAPVDPVESPKPVEAVEEVEEVEAVETAPIVLESTVITSDYAPPKYTQVSAPQIPLNARNMVLFVLGVVLIAVVASATLFFFLERRLTPPVTAPVSSDH
jgi:hypothetical protein